MSMVISAPIMLRAGRIEESISVTLPAVPTSIATLSAVTFPGKNLNFVLPNSSPMTVEDVTFLNARTAARCWLRSPGFGLLDLMFVISKGLPVARERRRAVLRI